MVFVNILAGTVCLSLLRLLRKVKTLSKSYVDIM